MKFTVRWLIILLISAHSSLAFASEWIILKWSSYPGHENVHEFYFREGKVLYLIRYENSDEKRGNDFPAWEAFDISPTKQDKVAALLNRVILNSKDKGKPKPLCNGFQWIVDIRYGNYDTFYVNRCDSRETYEAIKDLIGFALEE